MYFCPGIGIRGDTERPSDGFLYQPFSAGRSVNRLLEAKLKFHFDTRGRRAKHYRAEQSRARVSLFTFFPVASKSTDSHSYLKHIACLIKVKITQLDVGEASHKSLRNIINSANRMIV